MFQEFSRRQFVQTAAATVGLPMILPSGLLARQSPNEKLSFACIGMGGQMRGYLIPELNKLDQKIVAICDVDKRQLDSALQVNELKEARSEKWGPLAYTYVSNWLVANRLRTG
jgi:hypothetical protein